MAYVVAIHNISDPEGFWNTNSWEADSVDTVRELVDGFAGDYSRNEFFEVDTQHAGTTGLPTSAAAQA